MAEAPSAGGSRCLCPLAVAASPPRWEVGIYAAGALALLGIAALNLWKLWRSGSYPAPSPFPNYDYRYLEQKYGAACSDVKHKVKIMNKLGVESWAQRCSWGELGPSGGDRFSFAARGHHGLTEGAGEDVARPPSQPAGG